MKLLKWIAIVLAALAGWTATGLPLVDVLANRGWFGTCFEGACGYAAILVFLPVWVIGGTLATVLALRWWGRS